MNFDTYAKRLNWAMTNAAISQSELARAIGVKPQAIQYLCQKGTKSTHTTKIAKVLGVSADWLDTGKGQPHPKAITATKTTLQSEPAFCFSFHQVQINFHQVCPQMRVFLCPSIGKRRPYHQMIRKSNNLN